MSLTDLAQAIVDGVLTGGVYALMAAGLTLIFGVMDIVNIAQGAMVILGAYLSYSLSTNLGIDLFLGLLIPEQIALFWLDVGLPKHADAWILELVDRNWVNEEDHHEP